MNMFAETDPLNMAPVVDAGVRCDFAITREFFGPFGDSFRSGQSA